MSRSPAAVISALMTLVAAVSSDKSAEPVKMTSNYSYPDLEEKERHGMVSSYKLDNAQR
jgi:hypothetical protein